MDQNVNPNANINWAFQVNLSGLRAPTGAAAQLPEGYYKATITDAYTLNDKPGRVIIKTTISEGEFTGTVRTTGLGVPKSAQDGVRYYWRGLLESAGYTPAQIDAGEVGMNRALLVGKSVTVHYVPGDKEAGIYEELSFLPLAAWEAKAAAFARTQNGAAVQAAPAMNVVAQQAVGAALAGALGGGPFQPHLPGTAGRFEQADPGCRKPAGVMLHGASGQPHVGGHPGLSRGGLHRQRWKVGQQCRRQIPGPFQANPHGQPAGGGGRHRVWQDRVEHVGDRAGVPREPTRENRHAASGLVLATEFDEPGGREASAFGGNRLRVQAAVNVDIVVFVPCEAAGRMVFEERSLRAARELHIDVDQRQWQPGNEFDPLGERTFQSVLPQDQTTATDDVLAPPPGGRHAFDRVSVHLRVDGPFGRVFPGLARRRRRPGGTDRQPL
jgi:hypothetical protein